jgi:hypothetical protein
MGGQIMCVFYILYTAHYSACEISVHLWISQHVQYVHVVTLRWVYFSLLLLVVYYFLYFYLI